MFLGVIVKVLSELELVGEEDIWIQVVKPSDETWNVPKQEVSKVLVDKELVSIVSEKVTETFDVNEIEESPSEGELDETVGGVVSGVVVVVVLSVLLEPSSLLLLQEMKMELKRRSMEKMMSICLTWFPISGLGKPKLYQNMWCFTRMWGFYLEVLGEGKQYNLD